MATPPSIGHGHSHLMPVEDCDRLERAIDRAFVDVFGIHATAMPTAQGALFALRNVDTRLADAVLERAATHYRAVA
jgi:hypothetical protein